MGKLSHKQERFCLEYLIDLNATQAAIRAGFSPKTANQQASRLLTKVGIGARIAELRDKQAERLEITADRVLKELGKLAFSNLMDYFEAQPGGGVFIDLTELTPDQSAALQEITVDEYTEGTGKQKRECKKIRVKLCDKKGALDSIAKHLGMFTNKEFNPNPGGGSTLAELLAAYEPLRK